VASPLPLRARLLYASSSLGTEALAQSRALWLVYFYAPPDDADLPELLPVVVVGGILFAGRLLEAVDDALVGWWSDRTRSRLGRRLPFVVLATPPMALCAVLLFAPPEGSGAATAAWLFVTIEAFFLFSTLSGGPYEALLPELATTTGDRVTLVGMRVYFGAAGAGIGLVCSGLLVDHAGFTTMAAVMAMLALVFRGLGVAGIWQHAPRTTPPAELPFREALRLTLRNRHFLRFLPSFVLFQVGFQIVLGSLPYFVTAVLGVEDEGTWVAVLTATAVVVMIASVPAFARLAGRRSKRVAYGRAMLGAAVLLPLFALAGLVPGLSDEAELVALTALAGVPLAGVYLFPAALTADIVDDDARRTGFRREGMYYGAQNVVEKTATAAAPLALALLLVLGRSEGETLGLRLVGPVAALCVLAAWLVFRRYDLEDDPIPERVDEAAATP
jgi:glycoside/pentoside/hexuronide:cation symporter, GPH family